MMYRPMPYDPYVPYPPSRGMGIPYQPEPWGGPYSGGGFPPPFFDDFAGRGARYREGGCFPDFGNGDPRDFARGGALSPSDFASGSMPGPMAPSPHVDPFPTQVGFCARGLKAVAQRLEAASSDNERQIAALDGLQTVGHLIGVLSMAGIALPPTIMSAGPAPADGASRGNACREAGDYFDRMFEKYGSRGVGADIGEGADRVGSCVRELRDNFGF